MIDKPISIALAQLNSHLGNIAGNVECLIDAREKANAGGADIIVTPEMFLSGYPCDDLVLRSDFMREVEAGITRLASVTADGGAAIIVRAPYRVQDGDNVTIYNSVFVLDDGKVIGRRDKGKPAELWRF